MNSQRITSNTSKKFALLALAAGLMSANAHAGTDTTFDDVTNTISGWAKGSLGKTLSIATFVVGIGAGIMRQSLMAAVLGVGSSLVMNYGPTVIEASFSATI
jgi:conjugal transfer pilus assembly protein TraA